MKFFPLTLLAVTISLSHSLPAKTFDVSGQKIEVPPPSGYVLVSEEMREVHRLFAQLTDPENDTLAFYISEASAPQALAGELPDLDRYFVLKVNKKLKSRTVSPKDFSGISSAVVSHNKDIMEELQKRIPGYLEQISQNLSKEYDTKIALEISSIIPLAPHHDGPHSFAYSMFIADAPQEGQEHPATATPTTVTSLNASGKLLFLYAYGAAEDLDWTRTASESWHQAILAQNPPPRSETWGDVARRTLPGIVVGTLVAWIVTTFIKRKKARQ